MRVLSTLPGTLEKGGPSIILEFSTTVQGNLGHDKAQSYFIYISPSTIQILAKPDIDRNLRSGGIQWHWLQGVLGRTHQGHQVFLKNHITGRSIIPA